MQALRTRLYRSLMYWRGLGRHAGEDGRAGRRGVWSHGSSGGSGSRDTVPCDGEP